LQHFVSCQVPLIGLIGGTDLFIPSLQKSPFFENYELDLKEGILGDGSFSVCRKCTNRQTGQEFAVKIVTRKIDCTREINLLRACQGHPNIVSLHEVYYDEVSVYSLGITLNVQQ
jgi:ribosomal protein S6 kinase alpha-5